jgi:DNA-binding response OmpR family regulator
MKKDITVIEDDAAILELVIFSLKKENFEARGFTQGIEGLDYLLKHHSDLLILDLMLPDIDGFDVCKDLRKNEKTKNLPIIMLTAKGEETDKVLGLELGADDYIVKPFSPKELVARVRALLRRVREEPPETKSRLEYGDLVVDITRHLVLLDNREIPLTATEFAILEILMRAPKRVYTRNNLLDALDRMTVDRNIDVHITNLRKKLGTAGKLIKTIRGVGYKLDQ